MDLQRNRRNKKERLAVHLWTIKESMFVCNCKRHSRYLLPPPFLVSFHLQHDPCDLQHFSIAWHYQEFDSSALVLKKPSNLPRCFICNPYKEGTSLPPHGQLPVTSYQLVKESLQDNKVCAHRSIGLNYSFGH